MIRRLAVAALAVIVAACGVGGATTTVAPLPPPTTADLAALFDPQVAPLGYRVTRAALIDPGTYEATPDGTHLAVYLAPVAEMTDDQFAAGVLPTALVFLPSVFARWPGLASFDVCQEPFAWPEGSTAPSNTIVNVTRDGAAAVAWEQIDLAGLLAAGADHDGVVVWAAPAIRFTGTWQAAGGR